MLEGPPFSEDDYGPLTLGGFLRHVAGKFPTNEALVFDDPLRDGETTRWSYSDLYRHSLSVASGLAARGVGRGSRVGVLMGNRPEAAAALFGASMAGAVVIPLSTFAPAVELGYLLSDGAVGTVLTQTAMLNRSYASDVRELSRDLPFYRDLFAVGEPEWDELLATPVDPAIEGRIDATHPSDEAVVIFSSGTTSRPKGTLHSHRAVTLQFYWQADIFGRHESTRLWTSLPMFWTAGLNTALGATLASGGCWVMQETFDPGAALELIARERVTEPYTLPHQTAALEEHEAWATADLSSLKCVFGKSAYARHPSVEGDPNWIFPVAWGMSETCTGFASHRSDTPREVAKASTGRLLPGNRLRIVDPDSGSELGPGQVGELTIAGPTVFLRYLGRHASDCFDDRGFFHTGDMGFYDEQGFVHWTGRRSEMIKTGGASVSPAEIEVALRACPPVKLARVIGRPDDRLGQLVVLCVVVKDGYEEDADYIRSFLKERVSAYKVPRRILFFSDGEIPMTASATKVRDADLLALVDARLSTTGVTE